MPRKAEPKVQVFVPDTAGSIEILVDGETVATVPVLARLWGEETFGITIDLDHVLAESPVGEADG